MGSILDTLLILLNNNLIIINFETMDTKNCK